MMRVQRGPGRDVILHYQTVAGMGSLVAPACLSRSPVDPALPPAE